ncbi:unnamed protein product, partial [marine sediment metagenome]
MLGALPQEDDAGTMVADVVGLRGKQRRDLINARYGLWKSASVAPYITARGVRRIDVPDQWLYEHHLYPLTDIEAVRLAALCARQGGVTESRVLQATDADAPVRPPTRLFQAVTLPFFAAEKLPHPDVEFLLCPFEEAVARVARGDHIAGADDSKDDAARAFYRASRQRVEPLWDPMAGKPDHHGGLPTDHKCYSVYTALALRLTGIQWMVDALLCGMVADVPAPESPSKVNKTTCILSHRLPPWRRPGGVARGTPRTEDERTERLEAVREWMLVMDTHINLTLLMEDEELWTDQAVRAHAKWPLYLPDVVRVFHDG